VEKLPLYHRDPFDRLLVAQAQAENLILLTIDKSFANYGVEAILCRA
jgi:PIN domain nuclease of toxin-antitoxin system